MNAPLPSVIHPEQAARTATVYPVAPFHARRIENPEQMNARASFFSGRYDGVEGMAPFGYGVGLYTTFDYSDRIATALNAAVSEVMVGKEIRGASAPAFLVPGSVEDALTTDANQDARVTSVWMERKENDHFHTLDLQGCRLDYSAYDTELVYEPTGEVVGYMDAEAAAFTPDHLNAALAERCVSPC